MGASGVAVRSAVYRLASGGATITNMPPHRARCNYRECLPVPTHLIGPIRTRSIFALMLSLPLLTPVLVHAAALSTQQIREISQAASAALETNRLPGLSVAVAK